MRSPIGVEDMVFGENFYDSVQCAVCSVQVVARPDSVECLEFAINIYIDQKINRVQ